jgi:hypothetical protein
MARTKSHRLGGSNNTHSFSHNSVEQKSKIKVLAGLVSSRTSPLGLQRDFFSTGVLHGFPFVHAFALISSSYNDPCHMLEVGHRAHVYNLILP